MRSYTPRFLRFAQFAATGAVMFQIGGCTFTELNEFAQTVLLGITSAGAIAIIQNI